MKFTQYALVDEQGDDATKINQDDSEAPLVTMSLEGLIDDIADWDDSSCSYVLRRLDPKTGVIKLDGGDFRIVRREVEEKPLDPADVGVLAGLITEDSDED